MSKENHSNKIEQTFRAIAEEVFDERTRNDTVPLRVQTSKDVNIDENVRERINELMLISHKPYLTKKEVALYLDVSERSITEWSSRPPDKNPLPVVHAGSEPRFKRDAVDEWLHREGKLRRLRAVS